MSDLHWAVSARLNSKTAVVAMGVGTVCPAVGAGVGGGGTGVGGGGGTGVGDGVTVDVAVAVPVGLADASVGVEDGGVGAGPALAWSEPFPTANSVASTAKPTTASASATPRANVVGVTTICLRISQSRFALGLEVYTPRVERVQLSRARGRGGVYVLPLLFGANGPRRGAVEASSGIGPI